MPVIIATVPPKRGLAVTEAFGEDVPRGFVRLPIDTQEPLVPLSVILKF